jgi:hypothetical protein
MGEHSTVVKKLYLIVERHDKDKSPFQWRRRDRGASKTSRRRKAVARASRFFNIANTLAMGVGDVDTTGGCGVGVGAAIAIGRRGRSDFLRGFVTLTGSGVGGITAVRTGRDATGTTISLGGRGAGRRFGVGPFRISRRWRYITNQTITTRTASKIGVFMDRSQRFNTSNTKYELRNTKQIQNPKKQGRKRRTLSFWFF